MVKKWGIVLKGREDLLSSSKAHRVGKIYCTAPGKGRYNPWKTHLLIALELDQRQGHPTYYVSNQHTISNIWKHASNA
jgi:hypothetical protein